MADSKEKRMKNRRNDTSSSSFSPLSKSPLPEGNTTAIDMYTPILMMREEASMDRMTEDSDIFGLVEQRVHGGGRGSRRGDHYSTMPTRKREEDEEDEREGEREGEEERMREDAEYIRASSTSRAESEMSLLAPAFLGDEDGIWALIFPCSIQKQEIIYYV